MATEIERKFLVAGEIPDGEDTEIVQAYLSLEPRANRPRPHRERQGDTHDQRKERGHFPR